MDQPSSTPAPAGVPEPPAESGIEVEERDDGVRITLPRLRSTGDILTAVLAGAVAVWIAVWLDAMAPGRGVSALGRALMAAVGLFFGVLAVSEAWPMLTRRVIDIRDDAIALGRRLGVRTLFTRTIPTAEITSVDRLPEPGTTGPEAMEVKIRAGDRETGVGRHLEDGALDWLEAVLRWGWGRS
ncbi:MAG: hypothetical protein ACN0LA_10645 [Candidatus Longimicrobiales bacterium M2_2A_002]